MQGVDTGERRWRVIVARVQNFCLRRRKFAGNKQWGRFPNIVNVSNVSEFYT